MPSGNPSLEAVSVNESNHGSVGQSVFPLYLLYRFPREPLSCRVSVSPCFPTSPRGVARTLHPQTSLPCSCPISHQARQMIRGTLAQWFMGYCPWSKDLREILLRLQSQECQLFVDFLTKSLVK